MSRQLALNVDTGLVEVDHSPADDLDYALDCQEWLADIGSPSIATAQVTVVSPDGTTNPLTIHDVAFTASTITFWLTGGEPFFVYEVRIRFTTASTPARTKDFSVFVHSVPA